MPVTVIVASSPAAKADGGSTSGAMVQRPVQRTATRSPTSTPTSAAVGGTQRELVGCLWRTSTQHRRFGGLLHPVMLGIASRPSTVMVGNPRPDADATPGTSSSSVGSSWP